MKIRLKSITFLETIDYKSILKLVFSTLIAAVFPFAFEPYFKSIFSPEQFGAYDIVIKSSAIFATILTVKCEIFIPPSKLDQSQQIYSYITIFSLLSYLFLLLTTLFLWAIFKANIYILLALGLTVGLFISQNILLTTLFLKKSKINLVTLQKPIRRITEIIFLIIITSFFSTSYLLLVLSASVGIIVSITPMLVATFKPKQILFTESINQGINLVKKNLTIFVSEILNIISISFVTFFVYFNYDLFQVGILELANKIVAIPQILLCSAIALIIQNKIGDNVSKRLPIRRTAFNFLFLLIALSIASCLFIYFFSKIYILSFFDQTWYASFLYIKLLLIHLFFFIIFSPMGRVLYALHSTDSIKKWQLIKSALIFSSAIFYELEINSFLIIYSVLSALSYLIFYYFLNKETLKYDRALNY